MHTNSMKYASEADLLRRLEEARDQRDQGIAAAQHGRLAGDQAVSTDNHRIDANRAAAPAPTTPRAPRASHDVPPTPQERDPYRTPVPNEVDELRERVTRLEKLLAEQIVKLRSLDHKVTCMPGGYGGLGS